jgi:hypothetical protein
MVLRYQPMESPLSRAEPRLAAPERLVAALRLDGMVAVGVGSEPVVVSLRSLRL